MTTTCPACHKAVDSLRSRFVGVRDGKVVAYCSAICAASGQPAAPGSPATGVPTRIATPPAGIAVSSRTVEGPPRPITPPPGVPISLDSGPVITIEPGSGAVAAPRAKHPDEIPIAAFWTADKEKSGTVTMPRDPGVPAEDDDAPARSARAESDAELDDVPAPRS